MTKYKNMHIIQAITELEPAGAEKILSELSIELKNRGHTVSVVILKNLPKNTSILDKLKKNDIEIFSLNLSKYTPWKVFFLKRLLEAIIQKNDPQSTIIHSHLMHANLSCRVCKLMGLKTKLINTIHIAEKRKSQKWLLWLDRLTLKYCDVYTAVSLAAKDYHSKILHLNKKHIVVVNNGIKPPKSLTTEKIIDLKREWGLNDCAKIIGSTGRLTHQKGYDIFFELLPNLSKMIPKNEIWGIVILGEGEERKNLEEKISLLASRLSGSRKNLPDNLKVVFPGFRNGAAECAEAFDLFVMPSRYEGFGLGLLEAMCHGVPILSSKADSLPELMSKYSNGKCINFNDKQAAAQSILEYINKPKISDYKLEYTQEKMVDEYISMYKKTLNI